MMYNLGVKHGYLLAILALLYLVFIFINRANLFEKFDIGVVGNYLKSQDIFDPEGKIKDRVFISDSDIYIATGYLYANGENPTNYNGQHPPFIKYLFGFSAKLFERPLLPNIIFGALLLFEVYLLGIKAFKNQLIGFFAALLLLIDPVFKEVTIYALLDLGQMVFILAYLITTLFSEKRWWLSGIFLGLAVASKFYSPIVIFLGLIYVYKWFCKKLDLKTEIGVLLAATLVFCIVYTKSFLTGGFNIVLFQAKIIRFMLDHNSATEWGKVLSMFFAGWFMWPVSFLTTVFMLYKTKIKSEAFLVLLIPLVYLIIMTFQLPFTRYFVLVLPFMYLGISKLILSLAKRH